MAAIDRSGFKIMGSFDHNDAPMRDSSLVKRKRSFSSRCARVTDSDQSSISSMSDSSTSVRESPAKKKCTDSFWKSTERSKVKTVEVEQISGMSIINFFKSQELVYSALPVIIDPDVKKELSAVWRKNKYKYDYDFNSTEVKRIVHCIEHLKDDGTDEYTSSVEIRYIDPKWKYGLFANRTLSKGKVIGVYAGEFNFGYTKEEIKKGWKKGLDLAEYLFEFPETPFKSFAIDGAKIGNYTRYINHSTSEAANVSSVEFFYKGKCYVVFVTDKHIEKGEQFFYDYGPTYWKEKQEKPV